MYRIYSNKHRDASKIFRLVNAALILDGPQVISDTKLSFEFFIRVIKNQKAIKERESTRQQMAILKFRFYDKNLNLQK